MKSFAGIRNGSEDRQRGFYLKGWTNVEQEKLTFIPGQSGWLGAYPSVILI